MTKTLVLIRHGKSSWGYDVEDHNRPLKKRAYSDITLVAKAAEKYINKDYSLQSSSAVRALSTAKIFADKLGMDNSKINFLKELYTFNTSVLIKYIQKIDEKIDSLILVGHNPAFTDVANYLGDYFFDNIPTSGMVMIKFNNSSWKHCKKGKTIVHLFPKNLK